jgi:flagellar P-ring protein precursor FlgI
MSPQNAVNSLTKSFFMNLPPQRLSFRFALAILVLITALAPGAFAQVRIKDITDVQGIRDNQLVGYGLVVGLNGTGDSLQNAVFTKQSLIGMLGRLGINTQALASQLQTKDVAAVMVTADLPAFIHTGERIDVTASALGDAKDITGGTLLVTPLVGADGQVYAVAQGSMVTGAITASGANASVTQGVPTVGRISDGAIVERAVEFSLASETNPSLQLRNPDFTTAERIAEAVNSALGTGIATVSDPRTVNLNLAGRDVVQSLAAVEDLEVTPSSPATVVVDASTGTIVIGADVRVSQIAIAQGNLTIQVTETPQVSQPNPFSRGGTTVATSTTAISVNKSPGKQLAILDGGVSLQQLVSGLNSLGVAPHDMISILQTIKAAGALQASLVVE